MEGRKLNVLFAARAHIAAILRRGPSSWYHVVKWNTENDTFEHGAWIKGRLNETFCDISNDGKYLLYKVFKGSNYRYSRHPNAYTALSQLPWLKTYVAWQQTGTWDGGGRFLDDQTIGLNLSKIDTVKSNDTDLRGFKVISLSKNFGAKNENRKLVRMADWSGIDQRKRIIWTKDYRIYVHEYESKNNRLIADFSDLNPDPQPAPY